MALLLFPWNNLPSTENPASWLFMDRDASSGDKDRPLTVIRYNPGVSGFLHVLMGTFPKVPTPTCTVSLILDTGVLFSMLVAGVTRLMPPTV